MHRTVFQGVLHGMVVVAGYAGLVACGGGGDGGGSAPLTPPTVTSTALFFDVGQPVPSGVTLAAKGTGPFTWKSDALPAGLTMSDSGTISGTPAAVGQKTVKVTATGPGGADDETVVVTVGDKTTLVSRNSEGVQADGGSGNGLRFIDGRDQRRSSFPGMSGDARFVVFDSVAGNLGVTNGKRQVFLRDRATGQTELISKSTAGVIAADDNHVAVVSDDGRFVAWDGYGTGLVPNDNDGLMRDVFLRDRQTGMTIRLSENPGSGVRACTAAGLANSEKCNSFGPSMSADGNLIVFGSFANLLPEDQNPDFSDLYLYRRDTKTLKLITKGPAGQPANGSSGSQSISADGRFVAFQSQASNLVANDPDIDVFEDVFVYNVATEKITKISLVESGAGIAPDGSSQNPTISENGARIVFATTATNIKTGDGSPIRDIIIVNWSGVDGAIPSNYLRVAAAEDADSPSVTRDGQYLAFHRGPLAGDGNSGTRKVFVMKVGSPPAEVSIDSAGSPANGGDSRFPRISGDGRYVAYYSTATNLVPPDNNGDVSDAVITQRP